MAIIKEKIITQYPKVDNSIRWNNMKQGKVAGRFNFVETNAPASNMARQHAHTVAMLELPQLSVISDSARIE